MFNTIRASQSRTKSSLSNTKEKKNHFDYVIEIAIKENVAAKTIFLISTIHTNFLCSKFDLLVTGGYS